MYKSIKGTRYEGPFCGCGKTKKSTSKYCMGCANTLNKLRAKFNCARNAEYKEINKKELEAFIRINNL